MTAKLVGCVHDEIIFEVHEDHASACAKLLTDLMKEAAEYYLQNVPVAVDIVDHWS